MSKQNLNFLSTLVYFVTQITFPISQIRLYFALGAEIIIFFVPLSVAQKTLDFW